MGVLYPESTYISLLVISPLFLLNYISNNCGGWGGGSKKKIIILLGFVIFMIMLVIGYMLVRLWNCEENNICEDIKKSGGAENQGWVFTKNLLRMIHIPIIYSILYFLKKKGSIKIPIPGMMGGMQYGGNPLIAFGKFLNMPFVLNGIMMIIIVITYGFVRRINCGEAFIDAFKSDQKKNQ